MGEPIARPAISGATVTVTVADRIPDQSELAPRQETFRWEPSEGQVEGLIAERDKLARELIELRERVARAFDMAGNRWSEWGDRAVAVAEMLSGEEADDG